MHAVMASDWYSLSSKVVIARFRHHLMLIKYNTCQEPGNVVSPHVPVGPQRTPAAYDDLV
jgi:hypothetical protein